jgi:hypothetical protein
MLWSCCKGAAVETKFEFVLNLQTARALGATGVLSIAHEVIE